MNATLHKAKSRLSKRAKIIKKLFELIYDSDDNEIMSLGGSAHTRKFVDDETNLFEEMAKQLINEKS
ncbi:hypothetical protein QUF74_05565 [Candidatus Halobeggiatoa sp. HSG11]|nr:hypothetical protein [Candidatus Halobeggiatoa sp. HSG11]